MKKLNPAAIWGMDNGDTEYTDGADDPAMPPFSPDDIRILTSVLHSITEPARRHKCEKSAGGCGQVFECHLCCIAEDHGLHRFGIHPYICDDCIHRLGLESVMVHTSRVESRTFREVNYLTGEGTGVYKDVHGIGQNGRPTMRIHLAGDVGGIRR